MAEAVGPQRRALNEALRGVKVEERDKAAVQLAKRYAALIDEATPASKYREPLKLVGKAVALFGDEPAQAAFEKIIDALAGHSVMSDLGPKLLAVLTSLGMTPAGRGAKGGASSERDRVAQQVDEFSARRARKHAT